MSVLAKYLESIDYEEPRFDRTPVEPIHHLKEETYMSSNDVPALVEDTALSLSLSVSTQTFLDHLVTIEKFTRQALRLIKHAELQVRGFSLSDRLPPIARIERSETFQLETFQCKPLRQTLCTVLLRTNSMLQNLLEPSVSQIHLLAISTDNHESLYIESLNQLFTNTKTLSKATQSKIYLQTQNRNLNNHTMVTNNHNIITETQINHLCHYSTLLENAVCGEYAIIKIKTKEQKNTYHLQEKEKRKEKQRIKVARKIAPVTMAVNVLRSSIEGVSVSLFRVLQDTQELVSTREQNENEKEIKEKNKDEQQQWSQLSKRLALEKEKWVTNQNQMLAQWNAIEQALKITASSIHIELEPVPLLNSQSVSKIETETLLISEKNDTNKLNLNQTKALQEPIDHISVFETVAVQVPHKAKQRQRQPNVMNSSIILQQEEEQQLSSELFTVLTQREQLPELLRNSDRSGWSEMKKEEEEKKNMTMNKGHQSKDTKGLVLLKTDVKDHFETTNPKIAFHRAPSLLSELLSALPQCSDFVVEKQYT